MHHHNTKVRDVPGRMRSIIGDKQNNGLSRRIHGGVCQKLLNLPQFPRAPRCYLNNSLACLYVNFTDSPFRPHFSIEVDQTLFDRLGDPAFKHCVRIIGP